MWTKSVGLFLFVVLAMTAFWLGQVARRRFPRTYGAVDKALSGIELVFMVVVFFGLFYFTR
jgi:predicted Na+-dependent transporter